MPTSSAPSVRTRVVREPQRAVYDRDVVNRILDEGFICHVGFMLDGQPFVIPTSYGRQEDALYIHGSAASPHVAKCKRGNSNVCDYHLLDGLVLARSIFNHSMNYRSVVVLGTATAIEDRDEKLAALRLLSEHILPGRWNESRQPNEKELKATTIIRLPLQEFSAKVREGPAIDDEEDYAFPVWAGVLPLNLVTGDPINDARLAENIAVPDYVKNYSRVK